MFYDHRISPLALAECLHREPGFVWLDSPSGTLNGLSILASNPDLVIEGGRGDWSRLDKELERRRRGASASGLPDGAAIGYFRFDGSFCFGFYDSLHLHLPQGWLSPLKLRNPLSTEDKSKTAPDYLPKFLPEMDRESYLSMVRRAQDYIAAGDIYQVCLSHRFSSRFEGDPWPLYLALRKASPAPHAAYVSLGGETLLSSSPECFLKMSESRISTRPVKGTRPRRHDPIEDEREALELKNSPKENAELVMITDLERNDLGRVCLYGSVKATQLLHLERYAQVFHLVSTVEGRLRPEISHVHALDACFPGGSISGAPKKRALEIIRALEPAPRGLFTGAIGYLGYNGESQFNIAIRTVVIRDGLAEFHVGAGITSGSIPEQEWDETLHKAAGILQAAREGKVSEKVSGTGA